MGAAGKAGNLRGPRRTLFLSCPAQLVHVSEAAVASTMLPRWPPSLAKRAAFTLTEATVGLAVLGLAGTALLLATHSSLQAAQSAEERTVAAGMALQLLDEIASQQYMEAGVTPYQWPLGPNSSEAKAGRQAFDDLDDYVGYTAKPPQDRWKIPLGQDNGTGGMRHPAFRISDGHFATWQQRVDVYYVSNDNPSQALAAGATSHYRAVRVRIERADARLGTVTLADITRVFAYVPPP